MQPALSPQSDATMDRRGAGTSPTAVFRRAALAVRASLPQGRTLPEQSWQRRHQVILVLLWLHVAAAFVFALAMGAGPAHSAVEAGIVAVFAAAATFETGAARFRSLLASLGLITASAVFVHISGGYIEMHFHFFVMVIVISLYQDWLPFLAAIGYVVLHHGLMGVLSPTEVYNHPDAWAHPWRWAAIHGAFVLGASVASIANWRLNEIARARTNLLLESAGEGILGLDQTGAITFVNQAAAALLRSDAAGLSGTPIWAITRGAGQSLAGGHPAEEPIQATLTDGVVQQSEDAVFWTHGGAALPVAYTCTPVREGGHRTGAVLTFRDITERKRYEEQLTYQALYDPLTDLPNRRLFLDRLAHALTRATRRGETIAVLFMDLDRFKVINDSLGHSAGDALLVSIARRLAKQLRPSDTVARLGGDEFALLVEGISGPADALRVADDVLETIRQPIAIDGNELVMAASIGITLSTPDQASTDPDHLLRDGDIAMYQAKTAGGGHAVLFDAIMNAPARERLEMESDLRRAVERDELRLHYQPEVDLATGNLVGVEALVRWQHPRRGLLGPNDFIPLAEETGQIDAVGHWVLTEASRQLREWRDTLPGCPPLVMSVNLSIRQCRQPDLVDQVARILREQRVDPSWVRLEITESLMMEDVESTIDMLHALRALGLRLAIDDFGMGYSSLSYLHRLPAETLKIDRSFVSALGRGGEAAPIIRAVTALARALDMDVTAEGIESQEQLAHVRGMACDRGQGYYFARPLQPGDIAALIGGHTTWEGDWHVLPVAS